MAHGKKVYTKENERTRQYVNQLKQKYGNRTIKILKEKVSKDPELLYLEAAFDFANSYQKIQDDVQKTRYEKKLKDIYPVYKKNLGTVKEICSNRLELKQRLCSHPHCL